MHICTHTKVQTVERLHELEEDLEAIWLKINVAGLPKSLIVGSIYRPPNTPIEPFLRNLERYLRHKRKMGDHLTILAGDFNSRNSIWYNEDLTDEAGESLHQLFCAFNLEQRNHFPTNIYAGQLRSCLDLVATDIPSLHTRGIDPLGCSDHVTIIGNIQAHHDQEGETAVNRKEVWCWSKANIDELRRATSSTNWAEVLEAEDVSRAWETWKDKILDIAQRHIPKRIVPYHSSGQRPWMTAAIRHEIQAKHRLFREYKRSRLPAAWLAFKQQSNKVNSQIRKAKSDFVLALAPEEQTENSATGLSDNSQKLNLPRLHQLLAVFKKGKSSFIPTLVDASGNLIESDAEKAEVLNSFFVRHASLSASDGVLPNILAAPVTDSQTLTELSVSLQDVQRALHGLDARKAPGSDGIPTRLLVVLANEIAPCVHHIFSLSLHTATVPTEWKSATVRPIYKERGSKQVATNYRPISLLSTLSKCLEKLIFRRLYSHLDPFLPSHQSGFRQKDSTAYQLARLIHRLASALDEGHTTLACFYDLSKAFDRVWHRGLLAKLYHFGVRGQAHAWITNYLSDRRQCVRLNGCDSSWLAVPAGVPQGSVLGPLLFLAYTIDLPNCVAVPTSCDQFADDTALTTVSPSPTECEGHLQRSVDATSTWLSEWKLAVNVDKTVSMEFTRRPFSSDFAINLNGNTLKKVRMQRHFGLVLTSDLRWTAHVNQVLSKAARLLHTLKRLRCTLSKAALTLYYCLYIRLVVEYGCVAWPKLPAHLRDRLERFQRRAFKVILRKPLFATIKDGFPGERKPFPFHFALRVSRADSQLTWTYTCR